MTDEHPPYHELADETKEQLRAEVTRELRDRIAALDPESPLLAILDRAAQRPPRT